MSRRYDTDGAGRWWCTEWAPQCESEILFDGRCQGTLGHAGDHWAYLEDGTYQYSSPGNGGGWIPPGHESWISPVDKAHELHRMFYTDFEVTDPELIAKLEAGDVGDDDVITSPCTDDEIEELRRLGRLPDETEGEPDRVDYGVKVDPAGVRFWIRNQMFTLARTELDPDDPESEEHRLSMARMLTQALSRLAGDDDDETGS